MGNPIMGNILGLLAMSSLCANEFGTQRIGGKFKLPPLCEKSGAVNKYVKPKRFTRKHN